MGRPRQSNKDLPTGLYRDARGRLTLKVFTEEHRARLGGKTSVSFGTDIVGARTKWAEVYGFRELESAAEGTLAELFRRFLTEDLIRQVPAPPEDQARGIKKRPKYAPRTQREYKRQTAILARLYGTRKYARSEAEAARGGVFRTMDVSAHIKAAEDAGKATQGNRDAALLGSVFRYAKECGLTEYNPCAGAQRSTEYARDREVDDQLFLELYAEADDFLKVWMDLSAMVGPRISDLLRTLDSDWKPAEGLRAIPAKAKPGQVRKKLLFRRTDDLVEVIERARALKRAAMSRVARRKRSEPIASIYLLPNPRTGQPYTLSGFETKFDRAKVRLARRRLGLEATPEALREYVRGMNYHMHDHRSRAADDADDRGEDVADFLGHTSDAMARRRYLRREKVVTPNPRIKAVG